MSNIEPARGGPIKPRLAPTAITFVVAAVAVYFTSWLALGVLRHIVMPIVAIIIAGYLARSVWRMTGRSKG